MILAKASLSCDCSFIVLASVIMIVNYGLTVIMTVNYDRQTIIVQATGLKFTFFIPVPGLDVSSASATRKVLLEQLGRVLPSDVDSLPDKVFLVSTS
jgi:hypothetical protein